MALADHRRTPRLRLSGRVGAFAALAIVLAAVAGCGSGVPSAVPASSAAAGTPSPGSGAGSPLPSVDGPGELASALAALANGYTFDSTVAIGGQVATHAAGRWVKGRSEFVVDSGGASITYRSIPPRAWVLEATSWVELDGKSPGGDPLGSLRKPSSVTVVAVRPDAVVLRAAYPAGALGGTGTDPVTVEIAIAPDGTVTAIYTIATDSGPATARTVLTPGPSLAPVPVPPAG